MAPRDLRVVDDDVRLAAAERQRRLDGQSLPSERALPGTERGHGASLLATGGGFSRASASARMPREPVGVPRMVLEVGLELHEAAFHRAPQLDLVAERLLTLARCTDGAHHALLLRGQDLVLASLGRTR